MDEESKETLKSIKDFWSEFVLYSQNASPSMPIGESFEKFIEYLETKRKFEYHQIDVEDYNNIWEQL